MAKGFLDVLVSATDGLNKVVSSTSKGLSKVLEKGLKNTLDDTYFNVLEKIDFGGKIQDALQNASGGISKTLSSIFGQGNIFSGVMDNISKAFGGKGTNSLGNIINSTLSDIGSSLGNFATQLMTSTLPFVNLFRGLNNTVEKITGKSLTDMFGDSKLDKQIDQRKQNVAAISEELAGYKQQKSALDDVGKTYETLSKKAKLTSDEQQKYNEAVNSIAQIAPESVIGYEEDGTPILKSYGAINKELERNIKLKQQSLRLEQNSLASDTLKRRLDNQKDYNKEYQKYLDTMDKTTADTTRKNSLISGKEDLKDYAKRLQEENASITQAQEKAYGERLKAHQEYLTDEQAIQQKYINQMASSSGYKNMSDAMKKSFTSFADSLDWSQLSDAEGAAFSNQLTKLGNKFVETSDQMGKSSAKIKELSKDFSDGKIGITDYTNGLTKAYEAEKKFDSQSFTQWRQGLQDFADQTGNMAVVNKNIDQMAQSLNKVTGINTDTWKKALSIDPAPIDASNKALQRYLQSYNTGVQNIGKGGLADKLQTQFQGLQDFHSQLVNDIASSGSEAIDVEYLVNASVDTVEPIQNLVKQMVADGEVTEDEIDLLLTANAEILNTGEISDETISQIANAFNMTEAEVRMMLNIKPEGNFGEVEAYIKEWDGISEEEKQLLLKMLSQGGDEIENALSNWGSLSNEEKQQVLKQLLQGDKGALKSAGEWFNNLNVGEKIQNLIQKVTGGDLVKSAGEWFSSLSVGEKIQNLVQRVTGGDLVKSAGEWFNGLNVGEKIQNLVQKATGKEEVKSAGDFFNNLNVGEKIQNLIQKVSGKEEVSKAKTDMENIKDKDVSVNVEAKQKGNIFDTIKGWFGGGKTQSVNVDVKANTSSAESSIKSIGNGTKVDINVTANTSAASSAINGLKSLISGMKASPINVTANTSSASSSINSLKSSISGLKANPINVTANTSSAMGSVNSLKGALNSIKSKPVTVTANVGSAISAISSVRSAASSIPNKTVNILANSSNAMGKISSVKSGLSGIKNKTVTISARDSASGVIARVRSALASLSSKTVHINATKTITTVEKTVKLASDNSRNMRVQSQSVAPISEDSFITFSDYNNSFSTLDNDFSTFASATRATSNTSIAVDKMGVLDSVKYNIELFQELQNRIDAVNNSLDLMDKLADRASGQEKINYLRQMNEKYREQQSLQSDLLNKLQQEQAILKNELQWNGFQFTDDGNLNNYEEKLLEMERHYKNLQDAAERASDAESAYRGNNEGTKNSLSDATKRAKDAQDSYGESLNNVKNLLKEYLNVTYSEMPNAQEEWEKLNNKILDNQESIEKINEELRKFENEQWQLSVDVKFEGIDNQLNKLKGELSYIESLAENSFGEEKVYLTNKQLELLNKQLAVYQKKNDEIWNAKRKYQSKLENFGFNFNGEEITNYESQIQLLKQQSKYYDEIKDTVEEYFDLLYNETPKVAEEWQDVSNEIIKINRELIELEREKWTMRIDTNLNILSNEANALQHELTMLESEMNRLNGKDKLNNINKQLELQKQIGEKLKEQINYQNSLRNDYEDILRLQGFSFRDDGSIENYTDRLIELKELYSDSDFSYIEDVLDNYLKTIYDTIPDLEENLSDVNNSIKDLLEDQLNITKDIEEEITEIYKKELEDRKDALKKSTDEKIKALEKEQQAYKDMREEANYKEDLEEQQKSIDDINRQIELAKRDTSLSGQAKLRELMKQLAEEEKKLEKLTQDKIDDTVNSMYDKEKDRIEEESDKAIEDLENAWSDSKIADAVEKALQSGLYTNIDGEIKSLQDAMIDYIKESGDAFGVMGQKIKDDLIGNLNIALDTMKNVSDIYKNLDLNKFGSIDISIPKASADQQENKQITINSNPTFNVTNASGQNIDYSEIERMIEESNEKLVEDILKYK